MKSHTEPGIIEIKKTPEGEGVFACEDLPENLIVLKIKGKLLSFQDTLKLGDKESFTLQVDDDKYIALHFPFFLVNHSCNPNCGITPDLSFKTIKPISKGQELRWDYSTSMWERSWSIPCKCGETNCRGRVDDFDTLPAAQQQFYIKAQLVLPFILRKL